MHRIGLRLAILAVALFAVGPAPAVSLRDLAEFKALHGRYAPSGDCSRFPQVIVGARGLQLDRGGGRIETGTAIEYAPGFFGADYTGEAVALFPYWSDGGENPLLVIVNPGERMGTLEVEPQDFGFKGGPPMPARFLPWLEGSPYARCAGS